MANFNFQDSVDYDLNTSLISEVISLYGIETKLLITQKINRDDLVFGDYTHLKTDSNKIYLIYMLPEESEDWVDGGIGFNPYGLNNFENINLFCSKFDLIDSVPTLLDRTDDLLGNLIVLPNNKIMEITNASWEVPGVNNLFTYKDDKSVIKLSCKPYDNKLIQEVDNLDISVDPDPTVPYTDLDVYFNELINTGAAQDTAVEVTPSVPSVTKTGGIDTPVTKPIVDKTEDDVWGNF